MKKGYINNRNVFHMCIYCGVHIKRKMEMMNQIVIYIYS